MAYDPPTITEFVSRFPVFKGAGDSAIKMALDEAGRRVDETWPEADFKLARMLYAAHVLTLDGFGSEMAAKAAEMGSFQSITSGSLSFTRAKNGESTLYERRFYELARMNFGGPRTV